MFRTLHDFLFDFSLVYNNNQTFHFFLGVGSNGKSKLVDLMSKMLGDYKATVPITLVTQKRNNIGNKAVIDKKRNEPVN